MSNSRKIKIFADASNLGSAKNLETNDLINFRRGDSIEIDVAFLQNGKVCDLSNATSATLEVLDIGGFNAVKPRSVMLLMRKGCSVFTSLQTGLELDNIRCFESLHATFNFNQNETSIASGEKWLRLFVDFNDGSRITFASGWLNVLENYSSEPNLLPLKNPDYYTKASADDKFLALSKNLSDIANAEVARNNLDVYSKAESQMLVDGAVAGEHSHNNYLEIAHFGVLENRVNANEKILDNLLFVKENFPSVKFCGGYLKSNSINWNSKVYSFCFGLNLDSKPTNSLPIFYLDVLKISAVQSGIKISITLGGNLYEALYLYDSTSFAFGKFNSLVCVIDFENSQTKLFVNGLDASNAASCSGTWGGWQMFSSPCFIGCDDVNNASEIGISNIKIFNSDISTENSIYSIEDFSNGVKESANLLMGIKQNQDPDMGASTIDWATAFANTSAGYVYNGTWGCEKPNVYFINYLANADLTGDDEAASLGIDYAIDYATRGDTSATANTQLRDTTVSLKPFMGQRIKIYVSFFAKKISNDTNPIGIYTNTESLRTWIKRWDSNLFNSETWTKVEEVVEFDVPVVPSNRTLPVCLTCTVNRVDGVWQEGASYRIAKFNFEIVGAVLSLNMQANANQIKDSSLNENHAIAVQNVEFSEELNPAHCVETLAWAGTQVAQVSSILIPQNSILEIYAKSASAISISASVNSKTQAASLESNTLTKVGEWLVNSSDAASISPSSTFTGKIEIFYKIERL